VISNSCTSASYSRREGSQALTSRQHSVLTGLAVFAAASAKAAPLADAAAQVTA
jgi:hypothetical protein